jgi:hypothetical protein
MTNPSMDGNKGMEGITKASKGAESHCDNGETNLGIGHKNDQSGLVISPQKPTTTIAGGTGSNCTGSDAISASGFDALWLKRPIPYLLKKSREKFGWEWVRVTELELISALTNPDDLLRKTYAGEWSQAGITETLLLDVVDPTYLSRLVKRWVKFGYVFKERGTGLVANHEYFPWGKYPPNRPPAPIEHVVASEHHAEFWLVPEGYWGAYARFYNVCGTRIGAQNVGEKRVVIDKLKLYGVNVLGLKDYCVYAYPKHGVKFACFANSYQTAEELDRKRADCKQAVQAIVQEHARGAIHGEIKFAVQDGPGGPHTTVPVDGDVVIPSPAGGPLRLGAEGPNASHPGQAETADPGAPAKVDYTNKLVDATNKNAKDVAQLQQDFNKLIDVVAQLPRTITEVAQNQLLVVKATEASSNALNVNMEGIKDTIAQLAGQVGSLVQALQQQLGGGAI